MGLNQAQAKRYNQGHPQHIVLLHTISYYVTMLLWHCRISCARNWILVFQPISVLGQVAKIWAMLGSKPEIHSILKCFQTCFADLVELALDEISKSLQPGKHRGSHWVACRCVRQPYARLLCGQESRKRWRRSWHLVLWISVNAKWCEQHVMILNVASTSDKTVLVGESGQQLQTVHILGRSLLHPGIST